MMPKLPNMNTLTREEIEKAEEICIEHRPLPQASTRAFTSKFKAGTLPLQAYQTEDREPDFTDNPVSDQAEELENEPVESISVTGQEGLARSNDFVDEDPEWDSAGNSSSDGVEVNGNEESDVGEPVDAVAGYSHVNQSRVTRSGRRVIAAKHFMYDTGKQKQN